jgi:hypothetical protein
MRNPSSLISPLLAAVVAAACAACSISVHVGYGNPQSEQAYVAAVRQPMKTLTNSASSANNVCAGGDNPDSSLCYSDTKIEIHAAQSLEKAMRGVAAPHTFAKANRDLLHGLDVFIEGLTKRNDGLAAHSARDYIAGSSLIAHGLALQRAAFAEYPASANITP